MPLSQNRASDIKFEGPLSSIGAPELKTVLLSLDGAPEYCHSHKKPPQIENTPEVCTAGSSVCCHWRRHVFVAHPKLWILSIATGGTIFFGL